MKIIIANDGSEHGLAAVRFAAGLVGFNARAAVKIVTVVEPAAGIEVETLIESVEELLTRDDHEVEKARQIADRSGEAFRQLSSVDIDITPEVIAGPAARSIVEKAEEWGADLIVLGSHGRGFWERALVGSISRSVVDHAKCSVLIVRHKTADSRSATDKAI